MCDVEPVKLESEQSCKEDKKPSNYTPTDCNISANECCPSIDPTKVFTSTDTDSSSAPGVEGAEASELDSIKFETAPFDSRFPNTNQTKHCYVSFLEHKRCVKARGEDWTPCEYFKRVYTSLCPHAWVEKWENQIEEGTFPGRI